MERFLNSIHYCIYYLDCQVWLSFQKWNPLNKFLKQNKEGLDTVDRYHNDKEIGVAITTAGGVLLGLLAVLFESAWFIVESGLNVKSDYQEFILIIILVVTYLFVHLMVFHRNKYLSYFKEFEQWNKKELRLNLLQLLTFFSFVIAFFIFVMFFN